MTSRLLGDTQKEVAQLERAWLIDESELRYIKRIDTTTPGAFGEVWLAEWDERKVAVKKLRESARSMDEGVIEEFEAEVRFMRTLRHRNIVFFYGAGVTGSTPFLVCEYLSRGSLRGILTNAALELPWETRLGYVRDTAKGMRFLHTLDPPRIHRDLKR
jgi:serine/threonine protein kinase